MTEAGTGSGWFAEWFDNPHYHQLYGHRSHAEANAFVQAMHTHWNWSELELLDLACGKGRHAYAAARLGHRVTGLDLSPNSIAAARTASAALQNLNFLEGDMRQFSLEHKFDGVLNLFTSFGYFKTREENMAVLKCIHAHLKPRGFLVLDFLDTAFAERHLVPHETVSREGVEYAIERFIEPASDTGWRTFVKRIRHTGPDGPQEHVEQVAALGAADLHAMLCDAGFTVLERFGHYDLTPWSEGETPRLIHYATKT